MILFVFALRENHAASWKLFRRFQSLLKDLEARTVIIICPTHEIQNTPVASRVSDSECAFLNGACSSQQLTLSQNVVGLIFVAAIRMIEVKIRTGLALLIHLLEAILKYLRLLQVDV